jgi:diguanylate cyclase
VVVLEGVVDASEAEVVAGALLKELSVPFSLQGGRHSIGIGSSVGIALFPADGETPETLVNNADTALYAAKKAGKGTWRFFGRNEQQSARS